jgi:hypothetical protein
VFGKNDCSVELKKLLKEGILKRGIRNREEAELKTSNIWLIRLLKMVDLLILIGNCLHKKL